MMKHGREKNCIQFLELKNTERVLFCADTADGIRFFRDWDAWSRCEAWNTDNAHGDSGNNARRTEGGMETKPAGRTHLETASYDYVIYRMSNLLQGTGSELIDKISSVFKYASPDGRLVLLMENPYALHLFAGEADENGGLFSSLQKHAPQQRMISCKMLNEALTNEKFPQNAAWYYPYPTLDFPVCIYSDACLPKPGECDENRYNFDHARLELFSETDAFDEVVKSGLFREFAGCYLIVVGAPLKEKIYYTRYSNERAEGLRIRTDILAGIGSLPGGVRKVAFDTASETHIAKLAQWEERLKPQFTPLRWEGRELRVNRIVQRDTGSVTFAYVDGISLEQRLDELLAAGSVEEAKQQLLNFCRMLKEQPRLEPFTETSDFSRLFGETAAERLATAAGAETLVSAPITDIDMICRNILIGREPNAPVTVIDYEWTFDFPIPVDYVIYRVLFFYLEFAGRRDAFGDFDFYEELSVTQELRAVYAQMESGFQRYVQGGVTLLADAYRRAGKPVLSAGEIKKQLSLMEASGVKIRMKQPDGWHEERREMMRDADGIVSFTLDFDPGKVERIELLPDVSGVLLRTCLLQEDEEGSKELAFISNGIAINPILHLYDRPAELCIPELLEGTHRVYVGLEMVALPDTFVVESKRSLCDLLETLANRDEQLDALYHSTSWKLTAPLRRLKGNE